MAQDTTIATPAVVHSLEESPHSNDTDQKYEDVSASTVFVLKEGLQNDNGSTAGDGRWEGSEEEGSDQVGVNRDVIEDMSEGVASAQTPPSSPPYSPSAAKESASIPSKNRLSCSTCLVRHLDSIVRRLTILVSTSIGEDRFIGTCGYTAQIIHYLISPAFSSLINRYRSLQGKSRNVPAIANKNATKISPQLLALSALASETRTTLRLLGLFPLLTWGSSTLKSPPRDKVLGPITFTQIISIILYQYLENVAWLTTKGVLSPSNFIVRRLGGVSRTFIYSVRFWLFYIILQILKIVRERQLARQARLTKEATGKWDDESVRAEAEGLRAAKKSLVSSLSWLPLCMHWSFENGIGVPQEVVGLLSFIAGSWALKDQWAETADQA